MHSHNTLAKSVQYILWAFCCYITIFCSFHATQVICENENCENPLLQEPSFLQTEIFVTVNKEACMNVLKNQCKFPSIWYIRLHTFCNDFRIICETQQMCYVHLLTSYGSCEFSKTLIGAMDTVYSL